MVDSINRELDTVPVLPDHVKVADSRPKWLPGGVSYAISDPDGQNRVEVDAHPMTVIKDEEKFSGDAMYTPVFKAARVPFADGASAGLHDALQTKDATKTIAGNMSV